MLRCIFYFKNSNWNIRWSKLMDEIWILLW